MALTTPSFLPMPFAENGAKATIPNSQQESGRASYDLGFPPETSQPLEAGGFAPARIDMQGILFALSQHIFFQQSGSMYAWSSQLDYNVNAHVLGSDGNEYVAVAANGASSTVRNPVNDVNNAYWKLYNFVLADIIYPVGSIYMTAANTNPGTLFGGTWTKIQGRFLLGQDSTHAAGTTGGASTVTLTAQNMPAHNHNSGLTVSTVAAHSHSVNITTSSAGKHSHTRGTMEIVGSVSTSDWNNKEPFTDADAWTSSGALSVGNPHTITNIGDRKDSSGNTTYNSINLKASSGWTGSTSEQANHTHTVTGNTGSANAHTHTVSTGTVGGNVPVSVMPPYYVVNIWRRTA